MRLGWSLYTHPNTIWLAFHGMGSIITTNAYLWGIPRYGAFFFLSVSDAILWIFNEKGGCTHVTKVLDIFFLICGTNKDIILKCYASS